jgi:DNA repair exonuclease SbcCD ATPase subunit
MTYLIAQIWLFIAVAAAVGLLFGWVFHGGVASARLRELRHSLAHARAEVDDQRREAAELAARAERRSPGASSSEVSALQNDLRQARDRAARLEAEARNAASAADRYSEEAEELRQRIAELTSRGGGASAEERAAWRERVSELEQETESLRRRLELRGAEADETLKGRIAELEAEVEGQQERIAQLQARAQDEAASAPALERLRELEVEAEALRGQLAQRAEPALAADVAQDRISELETEAEGLRARLATLERDVAEPLRAQVAQLEAELENSRALAGVQAFAAAAAQDSDELVALRAERDRLTDQLAARDAEDAELDRMRERIGALEADLDISRNRAAEAEARAKAAAEAEARARSAAEAASAAAASRPQPITVPGVEDLQTESNRLKWRNSYLTTRVHFLESRLKGEDARRNGDIDVIDPAEEGPLAQARAEVARLEARIAEYEKAQDKSGQPAPNVEGNGGSLEWRNRYLASRIRYLEQQLESRGGGAQAGDEGDLKFKLAEAEERLKDFVKVKAKVSELERALEAAGGAAAEAGAKAEAQRALEWRVRYLSSRVKYLEDRLSKGDGPEPGEPGPGGDGESASHNGA